MKIALLGYGRMGQLIEQIALTRGHDISCKIYRNSVLENFKDQMLASDVAIDFSTKEAAADLIKFALDQKLPVISGTTGWLEKYDELTRYAKSINGSFLYASNFSIGVNLFFKFNRLLANWMADHPDYHVSLKEAHHIHKADSPSGTAISLANDILKEISSKKRWVNHKTEKPDELEIVSIRKDEIPGTHNVIYRSGNDQIQIEHRALNRQGFALGAILAAEWIIGKKGVFSMGDVLNLV